MPTCLVTRVKSLSIQNGIASINRKFTGHEKINAALERGHGEL
jgi:hypothetical protein